MASAPSKDHSMMAYPRTLLTIIASVGGLAMFLFLASSLLVSQPIGYAVRNYFYGVASSQKVDLVTGINDSVVDAPFNTNVVKKEGELNSTDLDKNGISANEASDQNSDGEGGGNGDDVGKESQASHFRRTDESSESGQRKGNDKPSLMAPPENSLTQIIDQHTNEKSDGKIDGKADDLGKINPPPKFGGEGESSQSGKGEVNAKPSPAAALENSTIVDRRTSKNSSGESGNYGDVVRQNNQALRYPKEGGSSDPGQDQDAVKSSPISASGNSSTQTRKKEYAPSYGGSMNVATSSAPSNKSESVLVDTECDLYHGKWVHDSAGPLYTNNSCPVLTQMQNCQGNGRPDKDYENWRWKPNQCDLPRFDPRKFLEIMRGKTLAFIGDSVARNQMESMLCILWQAEAPKNRGNKRMQRFFFKSTSTMIVRIWSSWLVHQTSEPFDLAPAGVTKLHLDAPDEGFMEFIKEFDVIVLSSGHWFAKQSVYILNNEIVGGQLWWPDKSKKMKINNVEAFGISVETILSALVTHSNYSGLTIVRSYSPDHYEGGAWNTGGSCTGKVKPATDGELVENGFTSIMHEKQVTGFNRAVKKQTNKSKLKLMDITQVFSYRHDGHPGPYRSPDPNKITTRGPDGRPPPQDCLHWCMPGPVDTWNELVAEIIRREL